MCDKYLDYRDFISFEEKEIIQYISDEYHSYRRDNKLRDILNKMFDAKILHLFSCDIGNKSSSDVQLSTGKFIAYTRKGITRFESSEWAWLTYHKGG